MKFLPRNLRKSIIDAFHNSAFNHSASPARFSIFNSCNCILQSNRSSAASNRSLLHSALFLIKTCVYRTSSINIVLLKQLFDKHSKALFRRRHRLCNDAQAKEFNPFAKRKPPAGWQRVLLPMISCERNVLLLFIRLRSDPFSYVKLIPSNCRIRK